MFAHDLCDSQIEYLRNSIDFNRKDRAIAIPQIVNIQFGFGFAGLGIYFLPESPEGRFYSYQIQHILLLSEAGCSAFSPVKKLRSNFPL